MAGMPADILMMLIAKLNDADEAIEIAKRDDPTLDAVQRAMQECRAVFAPEKSATFDAKDASAALERALKLLQQSHGEKVTVAKDRVRKAIAVLGPLMTKRAEFRI